MHFFGRYLMPGILFGMLIVSGCGYFFQRNKFAIIPILLSVYGAFVSINYVLSPTDTQFYTKDTAQGIQSTKMPNETLVLLGWDTTPTLYYLGSNVSYITSYEFEKRAVNTSANNAHFLLIDSPYARKPDQLQSSCLVYQNNYAKIYRYPPPCN